ncbi:olfactory receptor 6B9-like [Leptodactylus fuscus]|uniref:olfactory receptor 6B9-like n=1 Tax=Leptodactylus fuscus TaxID=238119 RepID=UPI003F4EE106
MDGHLGNNISVFILIGFPTRPVLQSVLFTVFLIIYILTLIENVVIIITVKINITLHKPMYYFLGSLSFLEIWYVTVTIPNLLNNFITQDRKIYFFACMAQLYIFISLACTECFLLAVMAFDRYVAICIPLRYTVIMSDTLCLYLTIVSWLLGFAIAMVKIVFIFRMSFCGPNIINHFFCDVSPILNLACSDVSLAQFVDFILGMIVTLVPLSLILISYFFIVWSILKISSSSGQTKTYSTCASHLTIVVIFFSTTFFIYGRPNKIGPYDENKYLSLLYSIVTPFLNPIIYCFRNAEVKKALRKTFRFGGKTDTDS